MILMQNSKNFAWETRKNYIDRAQIVYNQIIEAEKSSGGPPTDAEITKLNKRFICAFYCGLRDDIRYGQ